MANPLAYQIISAHIALLYAFAVVPPPTNARPDATQELVNQANAREKAGSWLEAASIWNQVVLVNPTMPSFWERMGEASKKIRDYPSAIRGFLRALELGASYPGTDRL